MTTSRTSPLVLFLRTKAGRALSLGIVLKVLVLALGLVGAGIATSTALSLADSVGNVALVVGLVLLLVRAGTVARRHLLWRVRRKLILSYIFIGVVPALLIVAFFLLAGLLLFFNVGSYLIQTRVRAMVDDVRLLADRMSDNLDEAAGRRGAAATPDVVARLTQRDIAEAGRNFPGVSSTVFAAPARCARGTVTPLDGPISAGSWMHLTAPAELPEWLSCDGTTVVIAFTADGRSAGTTGSARLAVRAVRYVSTPRGWLALVVDVPITEFLVDRLRTETGIDFGGLTAFSPVGEDGRPDIVLPPPQPDAALADDADDPFRRTLTERLRWVAFLDYQDWGSGRAGTVTLQIGVNVGRLYRRISATPLASLGNLSFGQLLLGGLALVAVFFLVIQTIAFAMGLTLAKSITGAVHDLFVGTERVRDGDFSYKIPIRQRDQLGELAESFNIMTRSVEDLLVERAEKQRLEQELRIARQIQMSLLPQGPLGVPGVVISAHCEPAREVGGDYFDFLPLGDGRAGVLIADVAGKGTSAALYMAELKGLILSLSRNHASPRDLLIEANRLIAPHLDDRAFITMTYGVIDSERRTFTYARAGHCPLVYVAGAGSGPGGKGQVLAPSGMVVGLKLDGGEIFARVLEEVSLPLGTDDVVVLYTDGISEAMNPAGEEFGEARLCSLVEQHSHLRPDDLRERILRDIEGFTAGAPQHDDMTMLVLKMQATAEAGR